jgi:hypothetical protein
MGITNCPMHNNDSTQCVGLVSTNQDNFLLKSGIYVPMNVFNMCCYCLHHLKIQNGHQRRSKSALKPYGKQHFHLLENSRTEFNQTWQRCFLWGPKKLSWFVLTRPTHWVLSLLCIGQFVMPIILTWVLFCSKCAELLQFNPFSGSWEEVSWKSTNQNFQSHMVAMFFDESAQK